MRAAAGGGGRVTVGKGIRPRSSPESLWKEWNLGESEPQASARSRVFAILARFEGFERTSENRGVPGSSPGLAIQRESCLSTARKRRSAAEGFWQSGLMSVRRIHAADRAQVAEWKRALWGDDDGDDQDG